jgi:hypothetical protein
MDVAKLLNHLKLYVLYLFTLDQFLLYFIIQQWIEIHRAAIFVVVPLLREKLDISKLLTMQLIYLQSWTCKEDMKTKDMHKFMILQQFGYEILNIKDHKKIVTPNPP